MKRAMCCLLLIATSTIVSWGTDLFQQYYLFAKTVTPSQINGAVTIITTS